MTPQHFTRLSDLESAVERIRAELLDSRTDPREQRAQPLFRGHADATWDLKTTLERYTDQRFSVSSYNQVLCATACAVQSMTDKPWVVEHQPQLHELYFSTPPNYEFLAHARHHGFPSPLLDWTQSLNVALFFAFNDARPDRDVAVHVYVETKGVGKVGTVGAPQISLLGPYVATHRRHFLQQGQYTVAVEKIDGHWCYCSHARGFAESGGKHQDIVHKFTLPGSLKNSVLRKLHETNVNAFSLLGDENSLFSTLAFKEITLRNETSGRPSPAKPTPDPTEAPGAAND